MKTKLSLTLFVLAVSTLISAVGCGSGDDAPVSPNAATAAPARLPGMDLHKNYNTKETTKLNK